MELSQQLQEKIKTITDAKKIIDDFYNQIAVIIEKTADSHIDYVEDANIENQDIEVNYIYHCRGESDHDYTTIPVEWLEDGFDYVADYKRRIKEAAEKRKLEEAREKEAKEKAEYEKLKRKFEGTLTEEELKAQRDKEQKEKDRFETLKQKFEGGTHVSAEE